MAHSPQFEINASEGLLTMCCQCNQIRDNKGAWQQLDAYIGGKANSLISHGYCPECAQKFMKEVGLLKCHEWMFTRM